MDTNFGARLRELREGKKLTQWKLAQMVGLSSARICQYERGDAMPNEENVLKIESKLDAERGALLRLTPQYTKAKALLVLLGEVEHDAS